jgi:hypothetical protein
MPRISAPEIGGYQRNEFSVGITEPPRSASTMNHHYDIETRRRRYRILEPMTELLSG